MSFRSGGAAMSVWMAAFFNGAAAFSICSSVGVSVTLRWNIWRAASSCRSASRAATSAPEMLASDTPPDVSAISFLSSGPHCLSMRARRLASDDR